VEFGLVSGGRSNLTYRLTDAAGVIYALRRPPTGGVLSTAHDVSREWRFISALAPTAVPVPPPVAYWTTPGLLEAPQPGEDGAMSNPRYTAEMRERAVKMVMQVRRESGQEKGAVARVAQQLGIGREALRGWVAQAEVDSGARPGTTSDDKQRIKELERENSELRRANEILKAASAYFARELGPSLPR
jgi:transposase